jgi:hypothetical protein
MNSIELFIKEKNVNITKMETDLGLPNRSIQLGRGIPKKHMTAIENYLKKNYGFKGDVVIVDAPIGSVTKRIWNENFVPNYKDSIARYRDPENGLWKRFKDWQTYVDKDTGEIKVKEGFQQATDEVFEDNIGKYTLCVNGIKLYKFDK